MFYFLIYIRTLDKNTTGNIYSDYICFRFEVVLFLLVSKIYIILYVEEETSIMTGLSTNNPAGDGLFLRVERAVEILVDNSNEYKNDETSEALQILESEIKSATSSMTSVPEPLKILKAHYKNLEEVFSSGNLTGDSRLQLADILSVLATTSEDIEARSSLAYKVKGNMSDISSWGHEYVRRLCGEISAEYNLINLEKSSLTVEVLLTMVDLIVPFLVERNAEAEAIDLLLEVNCLETLHKTPLIDTNNFRRVCLYLIKVADYTTDPENVVVILCSAYSIYLQHHALNDALRYVFFFKSHL